MQNRDVGASYENQGLGVGKPPMYAHSGVPSMSPALIGNAPSYQPPAPFIPRSQNNIINSVGGDEDFKRALQKKPAYESSSRAAPSDDRIAGVKFRPGTNERGGMSDVFNS